MNSGRDKSDGDFQQTLLTDVDKWWEFLDPQTYELVDDLPQPTRTSASMLDWSKTRGTRSRRPTGFGFFNRCDSCGRPVPPDFTFCVHCGGVPHSPAQLSTWTIVVKELDGDEARETAVRVVMEGGQDLGLEELRGMFRQLPAIVNTTARRDQVAALVARLAEQGIYAKSFPVDDPSIPWIRETIESIVRRPAALATLAALVGISALLWVNLSVAIGVFFGLASLAMFGGRAFRHYTDRYTVDVHRMLEAVTGFDHDLADEASGLLRRLRDTEVRGYLTICLMEYYTLLQQFRGHAAEGYGGALSRASGALEALMGQILRVCGKYARLHDHLASTEPAAIEARLAEIEQERVGVDATTRKLLDGEATYLRDQLADLAKMAALQRSFHARLGALTTSMESLRARVASLRVRTVAVTDWEAVSLEDVLAELDDELEVFEQTFEELEVVVR